MFMYQEIVKFVTKPSIGAPLLPLFLLLDVPPSWDFIRRIRHPNATRQAFLARKRASRATVRRGWSWHGCGSSRPADSAAS